MKVTKFNGLDSQRNKLIIFDLVEQNIETADFKSSADNSNSSSISRLSKKWMISKGADDNMVLAGALSDLNTLVSLRINIIESAFLTLVIIYY